MNREIKIYGFPEDKMTDEQKEMVQKLAEHWDEIWNHPDDGEDDI